MRGAFLSHRGQDSLPFPPSHFDFTVVKVCVNARQIPRPRPSIDLVIPCACPCSSSQLPRGCARPPAHPPIRPPSLSYDMPENIIRIINVPQWGVAVQVLLTYSVQYNLKLFRPPLSHSGYVRPHLGIAALARVWLMSGCALEPPTSLLPPCRGRPLPSPSRSC